MIDETHDALKKFSATGGIWRVTLIEQVVIVNRSPARDTQLNR